MKPIVALGGALLLALAGVHLLTSGPEPVAHQSTTITQAMSAAGAGASSSASAAAPSSATPDASLSARPSHDSAPVRANSGSLAPAGPQGLAPGDGPGADATVQYLLEQSSPSDLPTAEEHLLELLGRQVWLADVTGIGRSRWPRYFDAADSSGYTAVRIQAAIARADGTERATVTLLWAGTSPGGDPQIALPGTVHLTHQSGTWEPIR